jgi:hypothetical protein
MIFSSLNSTRTGINLMESPIWINPWAIGLFFSFLLGFLFTQLYFIDSKNLNKVIKNLTVIIITLAAFFAFTDWIFGGEYLVKDFLTLPAILLFFSFFSGHVFGLLIYYFVFIFGMRVKSILKRSNFAQREVKTDIRNIQKIFPKIMTKSPQRYFKKGKYFIGFDRHEKPIYIDRKVYVSSHKQLIGTTGCGKGKLLQSFIYQDCINDDVPVILLPKSDQKLRQLVTKLANDIGKKVIYIELLGIHPQLNLFRNKSVTQIVELLEAAFGLSDRGTDADYYRLHDRASCQLFAKFAYGKTQCLSELVNGFLVEYEVELKNSPKFTSDLLELCSLQSINAGSFGFSIEALLAKNAVIYISGSMRHSVAVKVQKLLLLSVMQACETRAECAENHVGIYLDEFKYLISRPALEALGAIRDKKAHVTVAHQSLGDLRDCGADLDPESVVASINENCSLKFAYKVHDPDTADWLSRMTGTILVDDEQRSFTTNNAFIEVDTHERSLRQAERALYDPNMFLSLPLGGAIIIGNGLAEFASIASIELDDRLAVINPTVIETDTITEAANTSIKDLIDVG